MSVVSNATETMVHGSKLRRPRSVRGRTWRRCLPLSSFVWVLLSLGLVEFSAGMALAQDTDCKETMRVQLPFADLRSGKDAEARAFLWQHWSMKRCGELFLTTWSLEGVRGDSHYKIEVVRNALLLTVNSSWADDPTAPVYALAVPASGIINRTAPGATSYLVYGMERIKPKVPYDVATAKVIASTASLPASKYRLRFKDKDGKVITDF